MKKIVLVLSMISVIFLAGCTKNVENNNLPKNAENQQQEVEAGSEAQGNESQQSDDVRESLYLKKYIGTWGNITIKEVTDNKVTFSLTSLQSPPALRIAMIEESDVVVNSDGEGHFSFSDDGWGHSGEGTIIFKDNEIVVNIDKTVENNPDAMWGIFEGTYTFPLTQESDEEKIRKQFNAYMDYAEYLSDYRIDNIKIYTGDEKEEIKSLIKDDDNNLIYFMIEYSVKPSDTENPIQSRWQAGNGYVDGEWIVGKTGVGTWKDGQEFSFGTGW